jgi:membrane-associated phospholipid phosphatase
MCIQAWDIWLICLLQNSGDWLTPVMEIFTALGYPQAYMVIIAVVYWSIDPKMGLRMAIFLSLVSSLNSILKLAIHAPRPYWVSAKIKAINASMGFGMPSGHAQASTVWLLAGSYLHKTWIWIAAILIVLLIGISRAYLGVHFPTQVTIGWGIGIAIMICFLRFEKGMTAWLGGLKIYRLLLFIVGITFIILLAGALGLLFTENWEMPMDWIMNTSPHNTMDKYLLRSYSMASVAGNAGSFLGVAMGATLIGRAGGFQVSGKWWVHMLRIVLGLAIMALAYTGLQSIAPGESDLLMYSTWRFLGFWFISFLALYLSPLLFVRFRLMKAGRREGIQAESEINPVV